MTVTILVGDCRERMKGLADNSVDSVVCDPPYHLTNPGDRRSNVGKKAGSGEGVNAGQYGRLLRGFMGQEWDGGDVAFTVELWAEVLRVLKPGGHLVAFSGTRTYHRMAVAIEDAGFEVRDQLAWMYGSGFPKSLDVSKAIDKAAGAEREVVALRPKNYADTPSGYGSTSGKGGTRSGGIFQPVEGEVQAGREETAPATPEAQQWQGWGTALKPAWEPICLARKPLIGTVAGNVLAHGTGALNIDGCRVEAGADHAENCNRGTVKGHWGNSTGAPVEASPLGRWPANIIHDGSEEVLAGFPETSSGSMAAGTIRTQENRVYGKGCSAAGKAATERDIVGDSGSAARFFYCAKTSSEERGEGNNHPTVKPIALMQWLVTLVTPKGGTVLDPFMGSGSTMIAADAAGFNAIGCELSPEYAAIAEARLREAGGMFADVKVTA